ncbi:putative repeat protein (TIGR01451 family) [Kitasatospora sp. MAP12-15]|uniref:DUF7507 domain-containing protein n=1 Tax=unclassified Kitasatospora TaxID=2633591 RepID=UPI00247573A7|nr:CARDB domain-containing protein [Kitasatospora sp. MAP12-44]MDH6115439.1 putative repeat protein (TIGR01451 family) [Kitasatospora sp. MAP12-44]
MTRSRRSWVRDVVTAALGLVLVGTPAALGGGSALAAPSDRAVRGNAPHSRAGVCPQVPIWMNTGGGNDMLIEYSPTGTQLLSVPVVRDYGDIAFTSNGTLYGVTFGTSAVLPFLYTINPTTGTETASVPVTGPAATIGGLNALTALPSGLLLLGSNSTSTIYTLDPATGVSAVFSASFPAGVASAGDFLILPGGDTLALGVSNTSSPVFRIHPDNTVTEIGTIPQSFGAAQSGGNVFLAGSSGGIYELTSVPTAPSTSPLPVTTVVTTTNAFYGASSVQDAGTCSTQSLNITKSAAEADFQAPGETIHYTYTVTNLGLDPLTNLSVTDVTPGVVISGCGTNQLAPGQSTACQATYTTTAADVAAKNIPDRGHASAYDPSSSQTVTATSNQVTTPLVAISVVKNAGQTEFTAAGQTINYTYTVTNNGAQPLTNIGVVDNGPGTPTVACPAGPVTPGSSITCTAMYTTTAADVAAGKVVDTAHVSGTTPGGRTITSTSNTVTVPFAGLKIVKAVEETAFSMAGQTLHYTFTVTNTGNTSLSSLAVTDAAPGSPQVTCPVSTLAPGASTTCTATYTTSEDDVDAGKITDTATVAGTAPDGTDVTADSNTLTVVACTPCEDKDHGGCKGDHPGGKDPGYGHHRPSTVPSTGHGQQRLAAR